MQCTPLHKSAQHIQASARDGKRERKKKKTIEVVRCVFAWLCIFNDAVWIMVATLFTLLFKCVQMTKCLYRAIAFAMCMAHTSLSSFNGTPAILYTEEKRMVQFARYVRGNRRRKRISLVDREGGATSDGAKERKAERATTSPI